MEINTNDNTKKKADRDISLSGRFRKYTRWIIAGLILKIIFYGIGKECFHINIFKFVDYGNEGFIDIGNQVFSVIFYLVVFFIVIEVIGIVKNEVFRLINDSVNDSRFSGKAEYDRMKPDQITKFAAINEKRATSLLIISIIAFITGFILIAVGIVLVCFKDGTVINYIIVLAGIISEIAAVGFLNIYHKEFEEIKAMYTFYMRILYHRMIE